MQKYIFLFILLILPLLSVNSAPKRPNLSVLDEAILRNDFRKVKQITRKSRKLINPRDTKRGFPLYYAVFMDNADIAEHLLKKGAKVNDKLANGMTPLFLAVTRNQIIMAKLLVRYKANVNHSINNVTPLLMAKDHKYYAIASLLKKYGAKETVQKKTISKKKKKVTTRKKYKRKPSTSSKYRIKTKVNSKYRKKSKVSKKYRRRPKKRKN